MPAQETCRDDPGTAESCPGCGAITGVLRATGTAPTIHTWSCGLNWVISVVNPHLRPAHLADLAAAAGEIGRLRRMLRQVITLADDAPTITDEQLRDRLLTLASDAR
ncbi:MAG: hypothetical protein JO063_08055 [Pseudonocardiales bacterium]|nr:hypothetical protein [Pseudonocardiales bacterium]MBV9030306.1 hypothetical protein [Pseudonocardiales bacterium]MBW0010054.1 hypothetical protein [Pseudonocardiales bacterium]